MLKSQLFAAAVAIATLLVCGLFVARLSTPGGQVTTITFTSAAGQADRQTISWNDVRRACYGQPNGTEVQIISSTVTVRCIR